MPIACGENEATAFAFKTLLDAGAADIVQPSVTKVGGILEMKKIATLAAAAGATFVPHSFYFGPGLAATLHVVASTPGVPYVELPPGRLAAPLLAEPVRRAGGVVTIPDRPGLGADPDPDTLARYPYRREAARPFYLT
jgi:L-alanine-DL-glutamate epimerase-like enolase superfamily enzyme